MNDLDSRGDFLDNTNTHLGISSSLSKELFRSKFQPI